MPKFATTRDTVVNAQPAAVHAVVNDFHQWRSWSPWEELDPDLKRTYSGAESGVGAHYGWEGKKAGTGSMEITDSTPERIVIDLEFVKPFKMSNTCTFDLKSVGDATRVVWTMSGQRNLLFHLAGKLIMDKAIAGDFDKGLAKLKAVVEG